MTASPVKPWQERRAALQHLVDVLHLCLVGRPRRGVLGYASAGFPTAVARWRALPAAIGQAVHPRRLEEPVAEWVLTREAGGWAVRPSGAIATTPIYFTDLIPADDQNAAFDWASDITPDADRKAIHYSGPPPT